MHPSSGLPAGGRIDRRCGGCDWAWRNRGRVVCLAAAPATTWDGPVVRADDLACAWFEDTVHCDTCGACCREAFDAVPVGPEDDATALAHPDRVRTGADGWRELVRVPGRGGSRCGCLYGTGAPESPYRCEIYADRPTACRELEPGEPNCLFARRRVGLSHGKA